MAMLARARLTKNFLMAQPEGVYLASNAVAPVSPGPSVYTYEGHVAPPEALEAQWEQIKAAGWQGRTCNIYESPDDHAEWLATFPT